MSRQTILAAGSMLRILPKLLAEFFTKDLPELELVFGPSGSLRAKIESGCPCNLFISATSVHTAELVNNQVLKSEGILGLNPTVLLHQSSHDITQHSALSWIANERYSLGMSTTGLDPSADEYEILTNIAKVTRHHSDSLKARTRIITGGRETPNAPLGRNQYGWIMENQNVDLLLTLQSNAIEAVEDNPRLRLCNLPKSVRVLEYYGVALSHTANDELVEFYDWLIGDEGQEFLRTCGFERSTSIR